MDVPFHSSGALSRAHYVIVRKVESASSVQSADQHIFLEVKSIQAQLSHAKLQLNKCKEYLIILLYCYNTATPGFFGSDAFDFAFPHAINLAEAGNIEQKRLGYTFCSEMMPFNHEFRLMLINTLRKDLESDDITRICLALDNLIVSPNEDVIPAVQSRLYDLLEHEDSNVRRRALFGVRALASYNSALLERIHAFIIKALRDQDYSVVKAALVFASDFPKDTSFSSVINELLEAELSYINSDQNIIFAILKSLENRQLAESHLTTLYDVLRTLCQQKVSNHLSKATILAIFKTLGKFDASNLIQHEKSMGISSVQWIHHLLVSHNPNDVYLFLSCLEHLDVSIWAGTAEEYPPVLDSLEFERIMQLLEFPDEQLSTKTLRIVTLVDPGIVDAQISSLLKTGVKSPDTSLLTSRILNMAHIRHSSDGEGFAMQVLDLIRYLESTSKVPTVFKEVIEFTLKHAHSDNTDFFDYFSSYFIGKLKDQEYTVGPTALVIGSALATEVANSLPDPLGVLSALASRMRTCPAIVQEPCLIAMIRIRAECGEVPVEVIDSVKDLSTTGHRLVRSRCSQFLDFSRDKETLLRIVNSAETSSLPDFLNALESYKPHQPPQTALSSSPVSRSPSSSSRPPAVLKYTAYSPSPRRAGGTSSRPSLPTTRSAGLSSSSRSQSVDSPTLLPITTGTLTLVDSMHELRISEDIRPSDLPDSKPIRVDASRADLINLDSPFTVDMESIRHEMSDSDVGINGNFEDLWNLFDDSCDLRGWCNMPIDDLIRRLQRVEGRYLRVVSADVPPFIGELKIEMVSNQGSNESWRPKPIILRLRESEDNSCLWRLRCAELELGQSIQRVLNT